MNKHNDKVEVPDEISHVLCALRYGWEPRLFDLGEVEQFELVENKTTDLAVKLELVGDKLKATLPLNLQGFGQHFAHTGFSGVLAGGTTFRADRVFHALRNFSASAKGVFISETLEGSDWLILNGTAPSVWIGQIEGMGGVVGGGNLVVERSGHLDRIGHQKCHFRFFGNYLYYLVQKAVDPTSPEHAKPIWQLLVDTSGGGVPNRELLGRDFLVLQFVLGRQLRMPLLLGIHSNLQTVAATVGSAIRKNLEMTTFSPVPFERGNTNWVDHCWAAVLFEKIVSGWKQAPERHIAFWLAMDMYLDAMTNHIDWDYMRLHIALESFAFRIGNSEDGDGKSDVKDKKIWKAWVKSNEEAIRSHAEVGRAEALYQKVMGLSRRSSGRVIPDLFAMYGIDMATEMEEELSGRDFAVHQGSMAIEGKYDVDRDIRRVAVVRTMLVAVIAKSVGYGGAINGWDIGQQGWPIEACGWWTVNETDLQEANRIYVAHESSPEK